VKNKIITLRVTDSDLQHGFLEAAQLAQFADTIQKDPSLNAPGHCPKCRLRFEILDSIEMQHYYDRPLKIWVTRWTTTDYEFCGTCMVTGNQSVDVFETPRYGQDAQVWIEKRLERTKPSTRQPKNQERR